MKRYALLLVGLIGVGCGTGVESENFSLAAAGGSVATGGAPSVTTGGMQPIGGTLTTGGSLATGGITVTGGAPPTGGVIGTGGRSSTGGAPTIQITGGTVSTATDGPRATGGAVATGGVGTGGKAETGGTVATGGSASADCAARNYIGRVCQSYNDPINPSQCLTRLDSVAYPASMFGAWTNCVAYGNAMCSTAAQQSDTDCFNVCVICSHYAESDAAKQACLNAENGMSCKWIA